MNCWQVLGISPDATVEEIRKVYRALALTTHPDVNRNPDAQQQMVALNAAFEEAHIRAAQNIKQVATKKVGTILKACLWEEAREAGIENPEDWAGGWVSKIMETIRKEA